MEKRILLYYKYMCVKNTEKALQEQKELCKRLGLKGRIIIAHEGINGTVAGTRKATQAYINYMNEHELYSDIDFKESIVDGSYDYFPKLSVKIRDEIVYLSANNDNVVSENTGVHLTPDQVHELLSNKDDDLLVLDTRNYVEWRVGAFEHAIKPDIHYFRELPEYIDQNLDQFKDKKVLMYCTGGVRCELATAYLKTKGVAQEVYQIKGGIHCYVEKYPDGFFRGKNYVFDGRVTVKVNDDILGTCDNCGVACDEYTNCFNAECNRHYISCKKCLKDLNNTCSPECKNLVENDEVIVRPEPQTIIQNARKFSQ